MIEDIAEGKEKHRINKKHKVKNNFKILFCMNKLHLKREISFLFSLDSQNCHFFYSMLENCHCDFFTQRG